MFMPEGDIEEQLERVKAYLQPTRHSKSNPTDFPASSSTFQHTLPLKYIRAIHVPLSPSDNSSSSNEEEAMALQEQRTLKQLAVSRPAGSVAAATGESKLIFKLS